MLEPDELGRRRDDLSDILRQLRKDARLTGETVARRAGMSQSKISKIETRKILPSIADVERILRAVNAPGDLVEEVTALARLANTEYQDLKASLRRGLHHKQNELATLEATSIEFRYFLPTMITGLLQTPEYMRASLSAYPGDHTLQMAKKLERQSVIYGESKQFSFLLTEAATRWELCPPRMMAAQMDRLISVSHLPNVRIGIIPMRTQVARGPLSVFTVYDDKLVTAEIFSGAIIMRDPRDVDFYLGVFSFFERHAVYDDEARVLLTSWSRDFQTRR
ncbi:helix-turn-helix domain-containing protein [Thermomonospora umbrina]|uniref:Helix-turn-helix protein n=1 Tax=Thermomonospora umbrina TaxID=111806 RepID=A0A3D9T1J7_9ACTN|nr:helix-turn-helix transcriptional regulator [Thermomonospora umbrina]REE99105.1 helix-turn-helix protein [Thermomonospora umbrina]